MAQSGDSSLGGALDALWARFLPEIRERVAILEATVQAALSNRLSSQQSEEAHGAAHKLAGVLGTFGLARGTELARELEASFDESSSPDPSQGPRLSAITSELRTIVEGRK